MQRILGVAVVLLVVAVAASTKVVTPTKEEMADLQRRIEVIERAERGDFVVCAGNEGVETLLVVRHEEKYVTLVPPYNLSETRTLDFRTLAYTCHGGVEVLSPRHYPSYPVMLIDFVRDGQS